MGIWGSQRIRCWGCFKRRTSYDYGIQDANEVDAAVIRHQGNQRQTTMCLILEKKELGICSSRAIVIKLVEGNRRPAGQIWPVCWTLRSNSKLSLKCFFFMALERLWPASVQHPAIWLSVKFSCAYHPKRIEPRRTCGHRSRWMKRDSRLAYCDAGGEKLWHPYFFFHLANCSRNTLPTPPSLYYIANDSERAMWRGWHFNWISFLSGKTPLVRCKAFCTKYRIHLWRYHPLRVHETRFLKNAILNPILIQDAVPHWKFSNLY